MALAHVLGWGRLMPIEFSPTVTSGDLIKAAAVLIVGGGTVVGIYVSLRMSIADVALEAAKGIAALDRRVVVLEDRGRAEEKFQEEMRSKVDRALELLASLKKSDAAVGSR